MKERREKEKKEENEERKRKGKKRRRRKEGKEYFKKNRLALELMRAGSSLKGWSSIDIATVAKYNNTTKLSSLSFFQRLTIIIIIN